MNVAETKEFRAGVYGSGVLIARGRGMCKDCRLLDTATRKVFPSGLIRLGRCVAHPIQPNGKWDDDWCDMMQNTIEPELNEIGNPVQAFIFAAKE
jgi:hypothetical protein